MNSLNPDAYTQFSVCSENLWQLCQTDPAQEIKSDSVTRLLQSWLRICEENQASLTPKLTSLDREKIQAINQKVKSIAMQVQQSNLADLSRRLEKIVQTWQIGNSLSQTSSVTEGSLGLLNIPSDAQMVIFQKHESLAELALWNRTSRQTRSIFLNIHSWRGSLAFRKVLSDPADKHSRSQLIKLLVSLNGSKNADSQEFSKKLALEFFNQATDEVLLNFLNELESKDRIIFINLLKDQALIRTSLSLEGANWITKDIYESLMSRLTSLVSLNLSNLTKLNDENLAVLSNLRQLKELRLAGCVQLTGEGFKHLEPLSGCLQALDIHSCKGINPAHLQLIGKCAQLQYLNLSTLPQLQTEDFRFLSNLANLTNIDIQENWRITDAFVDYLVHLKDVLVAINLSKSSVTGGGPFAKLATFTKLEALDLSYVRTLTNDAVAALKNLNSLRKLNLNDAPQLDARCLENLRLLSEMRILELRGLKKFEEDSLDNLRGMAKLQILNLAKCQSLESGYLSALSVMENLSFIDLSECPKINHAVFAYLQTSATSLKGLNLSGCPDIILRGSGVSSFTNLANLQLADCEKMTDEDLRALRSLTGLQGLSLAGCTHLSDEGIKLLQPLARLQALNLIGCENLTNASCEYIAGFQFLQNLDVRGIERITVLGVDLIKAKLPHINLYAGV